MNPTHAVLYSNDEIPASLARRLYGFRPPWIDWNGGITMAAKKTSRSTASASAGGARRTSGGGSSGRDASPHSSSPSSSGATVEGLVDAWRTNQRINTLILEHVSDEGLRCTLSVRGGRGVSGEFAHLHNIRLAHLEKRAPGLEKGLVKLDPKADLSRRDLIDALEASAARIEDLLVGAYEGAPKRRGFRKGIFTTLSYFVSHEAHHRGRVLLTLKVRGETLDRDVVMRIWGWDQLET
ncbi:MAG: hypothetical protein KDA28_13260 [Phycisphaerales bacterium]|nr:hypothetical protein [Phycisphaerales bacterium]